MYIMVIKDLIFGGFWSKIRRDRLSFVSIDVHSPYTAKHSWRILQICLNALRVFSVQVKILLAHSETTLFKENHSKIAVISL
jgi:hypothetical protein